MTILRYTYLAGLIIFLASLVYSLGTTGIHPDFFQGGGSSIQILGAGLANLFVAVVAILTVNAGTIVGAILYAVGSVPNILYIIDFGW
jgi:hypothetical protein